MTVGRQAKLLKFAMRSPFHGAFVAFDEMTPATLTVLAGSSVASYAPASTGWPGLETHAN